MSSPVIHLSVTVVDAETGEVVEQRLTAVDTNRGWDAAKRIEDFLKRALTDSGLESVADNLL
jgi:hypothetical protein